MSTPEQTLQTLAAGVTAAAPAAPVAPAAGTPAAPDTEAMLKQLQAQVEALQAAQPVKAAESTVRTTVADLVGHLGAPLADAFRLIEDRIARLEAKNKD